MLGNPGAQHEQTRSGDVEVVKGRRIGAAPWVDLGLRRLLIEAGIDLDRDKVTIAPVPGAQGAGINFGVSDVPYEDIVATRFAPLWKQ